MGGILYLNIFPTLSNPIIGVDGSTCLSNTTTFKIFFFFFIGNKKNIINQEKSSQPQYIGDVLWRQKSRAKITMIK